MQTFLHKEIKHVYAVKREDELTWIVINHSPGYTGVKAVSAISKPHIRMVVGPNAKIIRVTSKVNDRVRARLCFMSCVETVKSLLGVKGFWILTPFQLYKRLSHGLKV